ncbi:WXG100 family type VII secretion target [Mycobacterium sp. M1]|uniref:WXG100 family type VII secretion target n=1 Tax=Mycolicibacter acidiphilus TaxID=2835306 RepID=A0ABS5RLC3_9MYCO|nr:WXG100 family type VII secretion target [Mycolicibacter acidiphilus]MBS9535111.1 WXG100 family type VII secretion target [Mycolicibacter acidiphilus]
MPEPLKVDLTDLRMSANHVDMHHGDLHQAHTAAHGTIEDSSVEWVGASALALQAALAEWQAHSVHMTNETAHHRDAFHQIADVYQTVDEDGAIEVLRTRKQSSALDL